MHSQLPPPPPPLPPSTASEAWHALAYWGPGHFERNFCIANMSCGSQATLVEVIKATQLGSVMPQVLLVDRLFVNIVRISSEDYVARRSM